MSYLRMDLGGVCFRHLCVPDGPGSFDIEGKPLAPPPFMWKPGRRQVRGCFAPEAAINTYSLKRAFKKRTACRLRRYRLQDDVGPSLARGMMRLGILFGCILLVIFFFWETYSSSASLRRISATAKSFPYTDRCDSNGHPANIEKPNCVDLGSYVFVSGPILKAFRKACAGSNQMPGVIILEESAAPRIEIHRVEKALTFRLRNGPTPCSPPAPRILNE
jgi:hypothetical protein